VSASPDTVAAIATPPGRGGVAVVRVSGPRAIAVVEPLFRRHGGGRIAEARRVYVGRFLERPGGPVIDEVLIFAMPGPHSYTGEDVIEVQCHGGSLVSRRILESLLAGGARPAGPGEFTKRALLNGRLDLAQAEAVADLIAARSEAARRLAWSQLEGVLSARVGRLRDAVLGARALCEAAIDFSEDGGPDLGDGELRHAVARVRVEVDALVAGFDRTRLRYEGARVVLAGKANVGKSSLLNALVGRERAIVTPLAGTTRDVVEASLALDQGPIIVADTAGIRETADAIERLGVERSRAAIADAACAVAVFDRSASLDAEDRLVAAAVHGTPSVAVLNKSDLAPRVSRGALQRVVGDAPIVEVSAATGAGLGELVRVLAHVLFGPAPDPGEGEAAIYRPRHREAALRAAEALARAESALDAAAPLELAASDLATAADALGDITGAVTTEDVLDRVFAEFCIGK
jgi:tRNA modification GTPase